VTFANVMSCLAVFIALATSGAYAANTIFSEDIVDGEVKSRDVLNETLGSGDVLNNSLRGADIQESTLSSVPHAFDADRVGGRTAAELATASHRDLLLGCDPASASFIVCGEDVLPVTLTATSDLVVTASGIWVGTSDSADAGECRIVVEGLAGLPHPYGQRGNVHDTPARGAPIAQTSSFPSQTPGAYDVWFECRETDADFAVGLIELTVIRVGTPAMDPQ
jgi:hypothetical protein